MWQFNTDFLSHARGHKYVDKYRGKNGEWVYVYDKPDNFSNKSTTDMWSSTRRYGGTASSNGPVRSDSRQNQQTQNASKQAEQERRAIADKIDRTRRTAEGYARKEQEIKRSQNAFQVVTRQKANKIAGERYKIQNRPDLVKEEYKKVKEAQEKEQHKNVYAAQNAREEAIAKSRKVAQASRIKDYTAYKSYKEMLRLETMNATRRLNFSQYGVTDRPTETRKAKLSNKERAEQKRLASDLYAKILDYKEMLNASDYSKNDNELVILNKLADQTLKRIDRVRKE